MSPPAESLRPAGFWIRVAASLIDSLVLLPLGLVAVYNTLTIKSAALGVLAVLVYPLYKVLMEGTTGATLGKRAVRVRVVDARGGPIDMRQAALRFGLWVPGVLLGAIQWALQARDPAFMAMTTWADFGAYQPPLAGLVGIADVVVLVSCVWVAFNATKRGLHDRIAKTRCVRS